MYLKVPYLAHCFLLSVLLLLARWSKKIPSNIICTLMTPWWHADVHLFHSYKFFSPGWTWKNCSSIHLKLNFFLLAQNNNVSNFLILQTYLSVMNHPNQECSPLQIHLSPANLTTVIHFGISQANLNKLQLIGTRHYIHFWSSSEVLIHSFFPFHIITRQKGFLCHWSTTLEFTTSWYPKFVFFTIISFQAQNTPLQAFPP